MFQTLIEGCRNNMPMGTHAVVWQLQKNPDIDYIEYGCLGECSRCASWLFLLVEGKVIEGQTKEELHWNLQKAMEIEKYKM